MSSILLFNTSFQNRGDALMVEAVRQKLGPSHRWSVAADVAIAGGRATRGMTPSLVSMQPGSTAKQHWFNLGISAANAAAGLIPDNMRKKLPLLAVRDVEVAFDLSGYCFGDHWGQDKVERASLTYRLLRKVGAKVVLMPRTWGPFDTISSGSLDGLFDQVDLAFARDERSLSAIEAKLGPANKRKLAFAPDYTHAVRPNPAGWPVDPGTAMLIPSSRVIDSGTMPREEYLALFAAARAQFADMGLKPRLLIHETSNDLAFIDRAGAMGFADNDVLQPDSAIAAKSMIAQASAVVTSRLHGLYNALNCEVPVAVVAWSFKYEEALKQYGCGECLVDGANRYESLCRIIERMNSADDSKQLKAKMRAGRQRAEEATERMWRKIEAEIFAER